MTTMRICIMANAIAVHTQRWAKAFAERGHDVTVLSIRAANIPGVRVITEHLGPVNSSNKIWSFLSYLRLLLRARKIVREIAPDVVNPHFCITHGVIAALSGLRPRVVNIWGSDVIWDGKGKMPWWRRLLVRLSIETADVLVSTSRFMITEITAIVKQLPPVHAVPFGVDLTRFKPTSPNVGDVLEGAITVGFVKTLSVKYAPDDFLQAAAMAYRRCDRLRFVLAGRGPQRQYCENLAEQLGIADRVTFTGFVAHDRVPALMNSFDILVNCSRMDSESFGVVICEASASGLPVVATDVGGVRETIIDGETGKLVPKNDPASLADAICCLAENPDQRREMGARGRRMVEERYDWRDNVGALEEIFEKVTERH